MRNLSKAEPANTTRASIHPDDGGEACTMIGTPGLASGTLALTLCRPDANVERCTIISSASLA